jgi:hypothetical protein
MLASETNETTYHVRYQSYVISLLLVLVPPAMLYQLGPSLLDGSIKTGELAGLGIGIILPLVGAYYMLEFASFTFSTDEDVFRWHWNNLLRRKSGAVPLGRVARVSVILDDDTVIPLTRGYSGIHDRQLDKIVDQIRGHLGHFVAIP